MRKIHFDNEVWLYKVGRQYVKIQHDYVSCCVGISEILNLTVYAVERSQHKHCNLHNVSPSDVKDYIEKHLKEKI